MNIKNISRLRRAKKARANIKIQESPRLTVFRSSSISMHKYLIILDLKLLFLHPLQKKNLKIKSNNLEAAVEVGKKVAERALENGIKKVVFDRSGYRYHGRIKALADSARDAGLEF